ncbi:hypothetical protein [Methylobacterium sp. V23]|uniref:hypothetical protein n=1 Tax=Methylobacterium sp. V23 TaxID=2044878 RepID=UPI000CDBA06B|nr:hypothetical protein [Methylobacterium sp. V23]POR40945.1 hypothetical protein CRT23_20835 [Methylobacterium sp. V23]
MKARDFNLAAADHTLIDLEGWVQVLSVMSDSREDVAPFAIRMICNALDDCVRQLRVATGTADDKAETLR